MAKKYFTTEQIISKLREAEVLMSQGKTAAEASRALGISEQTYYRWRREYGGMGTEQAHRLKELEKENARLKRLVADLSLDKAILKETVKGNFQTRIVQAAQEAFQLSERRVCRALGQPRSTQRYRTRKAGDAESLALRVAELASQYGRATAASRLCCRTKVGV